jgi:ubiquinone/menaquinone biosynthesis C-methylase UbiE
VNPFQMKGTWGSADAWLYSNVVARAMRDGYREFAEQGVPCPADGATIVDVGCGPGDLPFLLGQTYPSCLVIGIDSSPAMVQRATARFGSSPNLRFGVGDAMSLPLPDGCVNIVTAVASIKHWPDPARGIGEIVRVLRPGGTLCLLEVDPECSADAARAFVGRWPGVFAPTRNTVAAYFRKFVASGGIPLARLLSLIEDAGLGELHSRRLEESLCVYVRGTKPV